MSIHSNDYRIILTYNLDTEDMQSYYQFVMGKLIPSLDQWGVRVLGAWTAAYGDHLPNRQIDFICTHKERAIAVMEGDDWILLSADFQEYVTDIKVRIIPYQEGFQVQ